MQPRFVGARLSVAAYGYAGLGKYVLHGREGQMRRVVGVAQVAEENAARSEERRVGKEWWSRGSAGE